MRKTFRPCLILFFQIKDNIFMISDLPEIQLDIDENDEKNNGKNNMENNNEIENNTKANIPNITETFTKIDKRESAEGKKTKSKKKISTRRMWSTEESGAVISYFNNYVKKKQFRTRKRNVSKLFR